jgi:hypothetical protein
MWVEFRADNFRCFSSLHLGSLAPVNLIAGKNNAGKTALLEALHILSYPLDCELPFTINAQRGLQDLPKFSEDIGSWLFHNRQASDGLKLASRDDRNRESQLDIVIVDANTSMREYPDAEKLFQHLSGENIREGNPPRIIMRSVFDKQLTYAIGVPGGAGLFWVGQKTPPGGPSVFLGSGLPSMEKDLKAFSELEAAKRQDELLSGMRVLEPRLKRFSLLLFAGSPVIHGDIGLPRLVPISLMGEGVRRLLSILLAIATAKGGRVLIDEIENGLHYSVLEKVWTAIAQAAEQSRVQVFASTHSFECITAAHRAFAEREPYAFRYFRLDRRGEEVLVKSFNKEMLDAVEASDLEVR